MIDLPEPKKGQWINPLLPVFALAILGGLGISLNSQYTITNTSEFSANIFEAPSSEEFCAFSKDTLEQQECTLFNGAIGFQERICTSTNIWSEWSQCISLQTQAQTLQ